MLESVTAKFAATVLFPTPPEAQYDEVSHLNRRGHVSTANNNANVKKKLTFAARDTDDVAHIGQRCLGN